MSGVMAIAVRLLGDVECGPPAAMPAPIASRPKKRKARRISPARPPIENPDRLVAAAARTVVPVACFALHPELEVSDFALEAPRFAALDAVARGAEDPALQI